MHDSKHFQLFCIRFMLLQVKAMPVRSGRLSIYYYFIVFGLCSVWTFYVLWDGTWDMRFVCAVKIAFLFQFIYLNVISHLKTGNWQREKKKLKQKQKKKWMKKSQFCIQSVSQPKEMIRSINKYITHFIIVIRNSSVYALKCVDVNANEQRTVFGVCFDSFDFVDTRLYPPPNYLPILFFILFICCVPFGERKRIWWHPILVPVDSLQATHFPFKRFTESGSNKKTFFLCFFFLSLILKFIYFDFNILIDNF